MTNILLYMMHVAFIEIRSAESLNASKKFADIFHNLPLMLMQASNDDEIIIIYEEILEKSKKYAMEKYIKELKAMGEEKFI